jgi:hypothetical protein
MLLALGRRPKRHTRAAPVLPRGSKRLGRPVADVRFGQSIPFQTRSPSREGSGGSRGDIVLWWTQAGAISSITPPLGAATSQPWSLPQLWIRVKVRPHLAGSANSDSASRRSKASSSSLSVSSRRDSSATLN